MLLCNQGHGRDACAGARRVSMAVMLVPVLVGVPKMGPPSVLFASPFLYHARFMQHARRHQLLRDCSHTQSPRPNVSNFDHGSPIRPFLPSPMRWPDTWPDRRGGDWRNSPRVCPSVPLPCAALATTREEKQTNEKHRRGEDFGCICSWADWLPLTRNWTSPSIIVPLCRLLDIVFLGAVAQNSIVQKTDQKI